MDSPGAGDRLVLVRSVAPADRRAPTTIVRIYCDPFMILRLRSLNDRAPPHQPGADVGCGFASSRCTAMQGRASDPRLRPGERRAMARSRRAARREKRQFEVADAAAFRFGAHYGGVCSTSSITSWPSVAPLIHDCLNLEPEDACSSRTSSHLLLQARIHVGAGQADGLQGAGSPRLADQPLIERAGFRPMAPMIDYRIRTFSTGTRL